MVWIVSRARRGQIWLVDFGVPVGHEQGKARPALVVSADSWNAHASTLTVLPITRTSHDFPTRIELEATAASGLDVTSYARCEDIRAISERRLLRALGRVDPVVMLSVSRTLRLLLDA
jgi:mRNA interferase MazF